MGAHLVEAFRTAHVLFVLALQDRHVPMFDRAAALLANRWAGQIHPMGLGPADDPHPHAPSRRTLGPPEEIA